eukprot:360150-Pelagomonas_calceolata.AAC.11
MLQRSKKQHDRVSSAARIGPAHDRTSLVVDPMAGTPSWIFKLASNHQRSVDCCSWVVQPCSNDSFCGGALGSVLVGEPIGAGVGAEGRTSVGLPLMQAAAPNLAQSCGVL